MFRRYRFKPPEKVLLKNLEKQQKQLASRVKIEPLKSTPKLIAGIDSSLIGQDKIFSVIVIFDYPSLNIVEIKHSISDIIIPYIPNFLGFREFPNILRVYDKLENEPDLMFFDGNGIIHKRKLGIASHVGVLINKPTIGIAKKLLVGTYELTGTQRGQYSDVLYNNEHLGFAMRTKENVKPVFISPGHLVNFEDTLNFVLSVTTNYRLPEPTRLADLYSKKLKVNNNPQLPLLF